MGQKKIKIDRKYFEPKRNETTNWNCWDATKPVLREKFIVLNTDILQE